MMWTPPPTGPILNTTALPTKLILGVLTFLTAVVALAADRLLTVGPLPIPAPPWLTTLTDFR